MKCLNRLRRVTKSHQHVLCSAKLRPRPDGAILLVKFFGKNKLLLVVDHKCDL